MCACVCVCVDWCLKSTPPWKFTFSRRVSMNTELVVYFVSSWHERPAFCFLLIDFALRALCTCCWFLSSFPPKFFFLSLSISNTQDVHSLALFYLSPFFFFYGFLRSLFENGKRLPFFFQIEKAKFIWISNWKGDTSSQSLPSFLLQNTRASLPFFVCMCVRSDLFTYNN